MRRLITALLLAAALSVLSVANALAQVHGVTPLNCPVDNPNLLDTVPNNPNAGGQGTQGTPADDAEGGPIVAPIPINTGNAPFAANSGDAGQHSSHCR
jgi:hypothetical protein